jgi:sigma-B regulation protein RsbU (phosphoserine phosphatase)
MTGASPQQNIAMSLTHPGTTEPPERVALRLNRLMLEDLQVEQYFTMVFADIDLDTGFVQLVQAGHPHPAILRRDGTVAFIGEGGMPVGLFAEARFEPVRANLQPGDRLFLMSDGITECPAPDGTELGEAGLREFLQQHTGMDDAPLLESLVWRLSERMGTGAFPDDVSGVLFRFTGTGN